MELLGRRFGHIVVTEVVGQGGMGDVYAGYDEKLERKVALKVLNADQRLDGEARERLLREARALSKLEHPNICRIHDYIEETDVDLLVLEYIDGRTLHDALSQGMTRSEKLNIAVSIAEVLIQAHRSGIVHRDLKPENVMLTKTGEVKVLDFGLARWLNRARARSSDKVAAIASPRIPLKKREALGDTLVMPTATDSSASPSGRREFLATAVGITLGTPLYMSPEQARGETLTPASDMFSFGLLLQVLFTGQEPHPDGLTAREVILRVARGETTPVQGAPRDVTALIQRLKAFAPTDRPTAVEALERLHFLEQRPQRIARRTIIAVIALLAVLGVWRYTVDLQAERAIAVSARSEAESRRAQAEDLINFMVGDLRDKLEPVGRLEILDNVAKKTLQYASDLDPARMSVGELSRNAKVLHQLGEVSMSRGDVPAALPLFRQSLVLSDMARKRDPHNADAQLTYGTSHFWLGNAYRQQKQLPEALASMREYRDVTEKLAREYPAKPEYELERAYGHNAVGVILEAQGDLVGALQHYIVSLDARTGQLRRKPDDLELQAEVAPALNKVGQIQSKLGNLAGARDYFRRELETYRALVAADPKQTQWQQRMAVSLTYLGLAHWHMGDVDGAEALWREELGIERELAARDPENVAWQRNVLVTTRRIAVNHYGRGDYATAVSMLQHARNGLAALQRRAPNDRTLPIYVNYNDLELARALAATGSTARARTLLTEAIARVESASDRSSQMTLARAAYYLGDVLAPTDPARSEAAWRRAEQVLEALVASSTDVQERDLWARVLARRSRCEDSRRVLEGLKQSRFDTREVEVVLSQNGCGNEGGS
ncbi:MAG TPA: protein kinase [Thermoanaerobaculia bacterium]|jgi:serine/threonine protein kinase/tetratricopeptide (TPR) repeat protein|nr:protein kinase [Thermoanaerobaculia bacterium]